MTIRSHNTQLLQNYYDATDRRSRENPTSLEAQLLNMASVEIDDLTQRINREVSQSFQNVPTTIDNRGVYYSGRVPEALLTGPDQTTFNSVVGKIGTTTRTLTPFNDQLQMPTRIELDADGTTPFTDPILFTMIGSGDTRRQIYTVQYANPGTLPIPNQVTFWIDQIGLNGLSVTITVTGETFPRPAWVAERRKTTEVVTLFGEGAGSTRNRWSIIDTIAVRGLPLDVRLRAWSMPFVLPATPDPTRPYSTPEDRDVLFPRYWQISNSETLLKEAFQANGFTGLETVNSYSLDDTLVDIAVEPNTNGIFAISQNNLYYADRREIMPDLSQTGISVEPLFGLQVVPDIIRTGPTRFVVLSGIPYANASNIFQYRYTVNGENSILPNGALASITTGWIGGAPQPVSLPLLATGDYTFRLEMQDGDGTLTYDIVPYRNSAFAPIQTIDISTLVDNVAGLAFDSYGKLWIWTGTFAIPIKLFYDSYSFDADSKTIFVTDQYDSLQVA